MGMCVCVHVRIEQQEERGCTLCIVVGVVQKSALALPVITVDFASLQPRSPFKTAVYLHWCVSHGSHAYDIVCVSDAVA